MISADILSTAQKLFGCGSLSSRSGSDSGYTATTRGATSVNRRWTCHTGIVARVNAREAAAGAEEARRTRRAARRRARNEARRRARNKIAAYWGAANWSAAYWSAASSVMPSSFWSWRNACKNCKNNCHKGNNLDFGAKTHGKSFPLLKKTGGYKKRMSGFHPGGSLSGKCINADVQAGTFDLQQKWQLWNNQIWFRL